MENITTMTKPIYIGTLNGKPLRFFESPNPGPGFPWHSTDDLYKCLGLDHGTRSMIRKFTAEHAGSKELRIIDTDNGLVTIGPHYLAQALIGAVATAGRDFGKVSKTEQELEDGYCKAAVEASHVFTDGMTQEEFIQFTITAFRNQNGQWHGSR
jgi:hypothetical protein